MDINRLETHNDLEALFLKYNRLIYRYIFLFFYSKETAEDLAQETFIRAWKYKHTYNPQKSSIKTWLVAIARSLCFDYSKKSKVTQQLPEEPTDKENFEISVTNELLKEYIYSRLSLLSSQDKDILILRFYNEFSIEEISLLIDKSYDATKVAVNRAFYKLKDIITNENRR